VQSSPKKRSEQRSKHRSEYRSEYRYLWPFLQAQRLLFLRTFVCVLGYVITAFLLPLVAREISGAIGAGDIPQTAHWLGRCRLYGTKYLFVWGKGQRDRSRAKHCARHSQAGVRQLTAVGY
jgi:hypothetical protein